MNPGDKAPDFELRDQDDNPVKLSDHAGVLGVSPDDPAVLRKFIIEGDGTIVLGDLAAA